MMENGDNDTSIFEHSDDEVIGLAVFVSTIIVLGVPANTLVLVAYLISKTARRKPSNFLLVNMTVAQLITAILVIPLQLATSILQPSLVKGGGTICTLIGATTYPFYIVTVATMVCISVDRLYAIRSPLVYKTKMTGKRIVCMVVYTWLHGVGFVLIIEPVAGFNHGEKSVECGIVWSKLHFAVSALIATTHIVLPFILLMALNWNLVLCLRRQNRTFEENFNPRAAVVVNWSRTRKNTSRQIQERKVACMVLWLITSYLICWFPYLVTRSLQLTSFKASALVDNIAGLILHFSVVINPVLNLVFRKELRATIERLFGRRNAISPRTDVQSPTFLSARTSRAVQGIRSSHVIGTR